MPKQPSLLRRHCRRCRVAMPQTWLVVQCYQCELLSPVCGLVLLLWGLNSVATLCLCW